MAWNWTPIDLGFAGRQPAKEAMPLDLWLAFAAASAVLLTILGPTMLLAVASAMGLGHRNAMATTAGVALGDLTAMTASLLGLGVLLTTSPTLFTALKWAGAAYLVYLGIKLWRAPVANPDMPEAVPVSGGRMLAHTWLATALNPKSIVFFVAFLPQFLDPTRPLLPQFLVMVATFPILAALDAAAYASLAQSARRLSRTPAIQRTVNRTGGSLLIGTGVLTATLRRAGH